MPTRDKREKFWAAAKNLAIAIGIILSVLKIWDWVNAPHSDLAAEISFGSMQYHPGLEKEFQRIYNIADNEEIKKAIEIDRIQETYFSYQNILSDDEAEKIISSETIDPQYKKLVAELLTRDVEIRKNLKDGVSEILYKVSGHLRDNLNSNMPYDYSRIDGYWIASVTNDGSKTAEDVTLKIPYAVSAMVAKEGEAPLLIDVNEIVNLSTLKPKENARVVAWTTHTPSSIYINDIRLTHSTGLGSVEVLVPLGAFWQSMDRWFVLIVMVGGLLLLLFVSAVMSVAQNSENMAHTGSDENANDAESDEQPNRVTGGL